MPTYNIRGINIDFPFEAYDCQIVYMEKVIESLQANCNALLESPTGTGKTLCLLCATLAWRKSLGNFSTGGQFLGSSQSDGLSSQSKGSSLPTIVYASRTHSQIRQVIQELKRTNYRPKMVVLGSREQLCIHEEVSLLRGSAQTNACQSLCKRKSKRYCSHYSRVADFVKKNPIIGDEPIDIEDLVNIGRSCGVCPYYLSRELHKVVDIIFAPYNYLIEHKYRKSLTIVWANCVLIFDEAHNLERICADAASFDLPSGLLTSCISEAKKCVNLSISKRGAQNSNESSQNPDNYAILRALLLKLENRISEINVVSKDLGFTKPGPYMFELLGDLNITHETSNMLIDIIDEAALLLEEDSSSSNAGAKKTISAICRLESMSDFLHRVFRDGSKAHAQYYRVHVQEAEYSSTDFFKGKGSRILSWWCFNPGFAMEEFIRLNVRSIILTSGTLSPMDSFAQELRLEFPIRLENPHVINDNQIWAGVVPVGPSGHSFNSSYRNRDSLEYKQDLGNAIVNFVRIVPDGLLVFFPSYYFLEQCIGSWKTSSNSLRSNSIWERICKHKQPVVEPRQSSLFPVSIEDYMTKLKNTSTSGAVFFAVCRGKVSEGLDFTDHAGRAVVVTGLPFAPRNDPKVRLKREYLDEQAQSQPTGFRGLIGEEWYSQLALRAVNQAVGRVIRHRHDYGAIIFCDERFSLPNRQSQISRWIQPHVKCHSTFGEVVYSLTRFFKSEVVQGFSKLIEKSEVLGYDSNPHLAPNLVVDERKHLHKDILSSSTLSRFTSGKEIIMEIADSRDTLHLERFYASQANPKIKECSQKPFFFSTEATKNKSDCRLGEIVPANRSFPSSFDNNLSSLSKRTKDVRNGPGKSLLTENPCKEELIVLCSSKKPKVLKEESLDKVEQNAECITGKQRADDFIDEKNKVVKSNSEKNREVESKGAAFLVQVKEKLSGTEYLEFVESMRALKMKTMKIGQVMQSIINLFSGPERFPLLTRFKEYLPAKYQSMYELYLKRNNGRKETPSCMFNNPKFSY